MSNHVQIDNRKRPLAASKLFQEKKKPTSGLQADGEKRPAAPDAKPVLTVDRTAHRQLHQLVERIAMHQGFKVGAHPQIRGRLLGNGVNHDPQRVFQASLDLVVHVGGKTQQLTFALPFNLQSNGDKRRIIDGDTDFSTGVTRK